MKKAFLSIFAASLFMFPVLQTHAASVSKATISGNGVVYAPADTVMISFVVEERGENSASLSKKAEELQKSIAEYGTAVIDGYFSYVDHEGNNVNSKTYVIASPRVKDAQTIIDKLINNGATCVSSPIYSLENRADAEKSALKKAIENAKSRASACGIKGDPTSIRDLGADPQYCHFSFTPCPDGKVCIECRVMLAYSNS